MYRGKQQLDLYEGRKDMDPTNLDPTAGERARAAREGRTDPRVTTDPTAGERARAIRERRVHLRITDPTDPDYGVLLDPDRGLDADPERDMRRDPTRPPA
jgi:hypothetical protein